MKNEIDEKEYEYSYNCIGSIHHNLIIDMFKLREKEKWELITVASDNIWQYFYWKRLINL